jgi:hypothetical protein
MMKSLFIVEFKTLVWFAGWKAAPQSVSLLQAERQKEGQEPE